VTTHDTTQGGDRPAYGFLNAGLAVPPYKHVPKQLDKTEPETPAEEASDQGEEEVPPDAPMTGSIILADVAAGFSKAFIDEQLARPVPKRIGRVVTPLDDPPDLPHLPLQPTPVTIGDTTVDVIKRRDASIDDAAERAARDAVEALAEFMTTPTTPGRHSAVHDITRATETVKPTPGMFAPAPRASGWRRVRGWFRAPFGGAA
jgi:hypothetical protein